MTSPTKSAETTTDGFLGGALSITQPKRGYRAGVDPVLLAAAVSASAGARVLDIGCGVGVAGLCLAHRVPGIALAGLELVPELAALARTNGAANDIDFSVHTGDVSAMPAALRSESFDHVITNPPYFDRSKGSAAPGLKETSMGEQVPLAVWIDAAIRRLKPKGRLTLIQHAVRLPEVLAACDDRLGALQVLPLASRRGRAADRVIVHAIKGARGAFSLLAPLVLHTGDQHTHDGEADYCPQVRVVLRNGAALPVHFR